MAAAAPTPPTSSGVSSQDAVGRIGWIDGLGDRLGDNKDFFETYTGLKGKELEAHLYEIREKAWQYGNYPCVGVWSFLITIVTTNPAYQRLVQKTREGGAVIDMGTGLGQEIRRIAYDAGLSSDTENLWVTDLRPDLWKCGLFLFRDDPSGQQPTPSGRAMKAKMVDGDIFAEETRQGLNPIKGKTDVILAFNFLHLFDLKTQENIARFMAQLSAPGCIVAGAQVGTSVADEQETKWGTMWRHNVESWREMWARVGEATGTTWKVEARLMDLRALLDDEVSNLLAGHMPGKTMYLDFHVERTA